MADLDLEERWRRLWLREAALAERERALWDLQSAHDARPIDPDQRRALTEALDRHEAALDVREAVVDAWAVALDVPAEDASWNSLLDDAGDDRTLPPGIDAPPPGATQDAALLAAWSSDAPHAGAEATRDLLETALAGLASPAPPSRVGLPEEDGGYSELAAMSRDLLSALEQDLERLPVETPGWPAPGTAAAGGADPFVELAAELEALGDGGELDVPPIPGYDAPDSPTRQAPRRPQAPPPGWRSDGAVIHPSVPEFRPTLGRARIVRPGPRALPSTGAAAAALALDAPSEAALPEPARAPSPPVRALPPERVALPEVASPPAPGPAHVTPLPAFPERAAPATPAPAVPAAFAALAAEVDDEHDPWASLNIEDLRDGGRPGPLPRVATAQPASAEPARERVPREKRVHLAAKVGLEHGTSFFTGMSENLSMTGVFVATHQLLPVDSEVELFFDMPGGDAVGATAEVRWIREPGPGVQQGMGLYFKRLSHDDQILIERFVNAGSALD